MAQTLNRSLLLRNAYLFQSVRKLRSPCLSSIQYRIIPTHLQRRSSTTASQPWRHGDILKDIGPDDILSAKNLPFYQYVRKTIRQKSLPEIHISTLRHHLERFHGDVCELASARQLDKESRAAVESKCFRNLAQCEAAMVDILLAHDAEAEVEAILDPNIAYLDVAVPSLSWGRAHSNLMDWILEMYFQLTERNKWDMLVIHQKDYRTSIRIKGKSAFHTLKFETGIHELAPWWSWSRSWSWPVAVEVVVRPHFLKKVLPEVKEGEITVFSLGSSPEVRVEHKPRKLVAEWSEHQNVVRNKADALLALRQKMRAETWFTELEAASQESFRDQLSEERSPAAILHPHRNPPPFYGLRNRVVRTIDLKVKTVVDVRFFNEGDVGGSATATTAAPETAGAKANNRTFAITGSLLLKPDDLCLIHDRLSRALRRSLLGTKVRASYMTAISDEVVDLCMLNYAVESGGGGTDDGVVEHRRDRGVSTDSQLLQMKCVELDGVKERLAEMEEAHRWMTRELEAKTLEYERVSQTLKDRDAFIERMTKGKRDLDELIKEERLEKVKRQDSERYSLTKWLGRQESSLENLIDARYSDRMDLSKDKFHMQNQLDRALAMIEQQQKDLKEGAVRANDLTLQAGKLQNVLANKDRLLTEMQSVVDSCRRDISRNELINRLEVAESEVSVKAAEADEARLRRDEEALKVETLTKEMSEVEGRHTAIAERNKGKIEFLELTVDNLQTVLVEKEREKKEEISKERTSVEAMKKQMRDYIKKHAQASMDKDRTVLKLEKDAETLKKELEMSTKREEALQATLNRERSGREHSNYLVEEEKRAWVGEWKRRLERERGEWRNMENSLRERLHRLECENKEAKDTIENLIAFQQRKNRPE